MDYKQYLNTAYNDLNFLHLYYAKMFTKNSGWNVIQVLF